MAEIVNLKRARKARDRAEAERVAADNRIKHGTPRALRLSARREVEISQNALEGHRLETPGNNKPPGS